MVFGDVRPLDLEGRRYDLPTANEVAIVYMGEGEMYQDLNPYSSMKKQGDCRPSLI